MLLIDGDIIAYRSLFSKEAESIEDVCRIADGYIHNICQSATDDFKGYKVFISGSNNFRRELAVTAPYKGNRPDKPEGLEEIRSHLLEWHPSDLSDGEEADDRMAIEATQGGAGFVICSIDKDFNQVPGEHYNFVQQRRYTVTPEEGLRFFYSQILTGDKVDNIIGITGVGPVKAMKALKDCITEEELFSKCVELLGSEERAIENGKLLWLRREVGQIWTPPVSSSPSL